jgi:hypothetical protein
VYNYHDSRACGYKWSGILFRLDGYWMGLILVRVWDFVITFVFCWTIPFCLRWDNVLCWTTFPPWTQLLNLGHWVDKPSLSHTKHDANNLRVKYRCFLYLTLLQFYLCYYIMHIIIFCTCWVPTISVFNLAIFPCHSNLLVRSWRRFDVLRWGVLGEQLPPVGCLWSYGVFVAILSRVFDLVFYKTLFMY